MITTPWMHYLQERLYQWAEWYSRGHGYGVGYPPCSTEYRLMTEGIVVKANYPKPLPSNESAEEMEHLVKEMTEFNFVMAQALRSQYFDPGTLRSKSKQLNMSHSHFKHYVDLAHHWLAGRLSHRRRKSAAIAATPAKNG